MAELTKVFQGMSDSGTAAGQNFEMLQSLLDAEALKGKVLWSGTPSVMGEGQSITLTDDPSAMPNGLIFVWAMSATSNDISALFVSKGWIALHQNPAYIDMVMATGTGGHRTQKTLSMNGKTVIGAASNSLTDTVSGKSADFLLLQVLGA